MSPGNTLILLKKWSQEPVEITPARPTTQHNFFGSQVLEAWKGPWRASVLASQGGRQRLGMVKHIARGHTGNERWNQGSRVDLSKKKSRKALEIIVSYPLKRWEK